MDNNYYQQNDPNGSSNNPVNLSELENTDYQSKKSLAVTSLVLGICSVVIAPFSCCCVPLIITISAMTLLLGIAAIILAAVNHVKGGMSIAGLICGIAGILVSLTILISMIAVFTSPDFQHQFESIYESILQSMNP